MKIVVILVVSLLPTLLVAMSVDEQTRATSQITQILASNSSFAAAAAATLALPEVAALTTDQALALCETPGPALQFAGIAVLHERGESERAFEQAAQVLLRSASPVSQLHDPIHDYLSDPARWSAYAGVKTSLADEFKAFTNTAVVLEYMPKDVALAELQAKEYKQATVAFRALLLAKLLDSGSVKLDDQIAQKAWKTLKNESGDAGVVYATYDTDDTAPGIGRLTTALADETAQDILVMTLAARRAELIRKHIDINALTTSDARKKAIRTALE